MKTASRILGSAFFLDGFEVQDAPRYGAERRGAPIFAYVRAARGPIHERGIIQRPDLAIVADDTLVPVPAAGVLAGLDAQTLLLISSREPAELWRERLNLSGPVVVLPLEEDVEDRAEQRLVGVACAGAAARLVGELSPESLEQAVRQELAQLPPPLLDRNIERARTAYDAMEGRAGLVKPRQEEAGAWQRPLWIELPFEGADRSAPVIHRAANSGAAQTGLWRTMRPVIEEGHCNRCWWVCSTFCPDGAILVEEGGRPVIDYDHCKGCLICVAQCPPHAIVAVPEHGLSATGGGQ